MSISKQIHAEKNFINFHVSCLGIVDDIYKWKWKWSSKPFKKLGIKAFCIIIAYSQTDYEKAKFNMDSKKRFWKGELKKIAKFTNFSTKNSTNWNPTCKLYITKLFVNEYNHQSLFVFLIFLAKVNWI